jgi:hypothetical protein
LIVAFARLTAFSSAFQYDFQALEGGDDAFLHEVNTLLCVFTRGVSQTLRLMFVVSLDSNGNITYRELMHGSLWRYLPRAVMEAYNYIRPNRTSKRFRHFQDTASKIGYKLIAEQTAPGASVDKSSKDILSVLSE